ncbi:MULTISPECIES: oxidoreductase [unclassified Polaribacter]|uniref:oxidoreductase n=1 Tax=unclassified Polaribacter TaxID=196858 RepID=UPI0011BFD7D5|nr:MULTISPECIES: oxidoreductase [unclassified Polaribacter]TXD50340.1 SDR family oxidoreductase [Polaribacter sp. IC063]TXD57185.1 SDR family oxidoreductase [Polaribacter sp. IC066]
MLLRDKIVVVTGGAGLLGRDFCKMIIENGGTAIVAEYNIALAEEFKREINNDQLIIEKVNITSKKSLKVLIDNVHQKFGKIDAIVNSAYPRNKNYGKHFFDVEYDDFCDNLGMNLGGYFLSSQLFAKYFYKQGFGNIVNMSSIYGVVAPRFEIYKDTSMTTPVEYVAIKSGLLHLTKYMAKYFKNKNIRVNAVSLGGLKDQQPESFLKAYQDFCMNKGMLEAKDISGTLLYLLSDLSKYVNGQNIVVDDGFSL